MIKLKSPREIALMREAGRVVAQALDHVRRLAVPGATTAELDEAVAAVFREHGATPLFLKYPCPVRGKPPFPAVICASVNEQVVHGIPSPRQILREGDIVGIDIGAQYRGWHGDACVTYPVGRVSAEAERLLRVTQECLWLGIEQARAGNRTGDIGHAIQTHAEKHGYGVVTGLGGHGIGKRLHEDEPSIQHAAEPGTGLPLRPGMTFTIEPMINQGSPEWRELADRWTVVTADGKLSAQFEHTVAITRGDPEVLTRLD